MVVHATWYPTCQFVLQEKGADFIFRLVRLHPNLTCLKIYTEDKHPVSNITQIINSEKKESASSPEDTKELKWRIYALEKLYKCKICLSRCTDIVFIPCGHLCACSSCTLFLKECPLCQKLIENIYKTYIG